MSLWEFIKRTPKTLLLWESLAFLLYIGGIFGFFLILYAVSGN